jgi:hypothetical protein
MTTAPPMLLKARTLLLDYLPLDPAAVGIVGDPSHIGGYHCGRDRVRRDASGNITDYSVVESTRDRNGLSDYAAALDIGMFSAHSAGRTWTLRDFSIWLVTECRNGIADTLDIREVIYSPDGIVVRRWDRLGRRTSGDSSHLTHTHISEFRDALGRRMPALMTRWLTHIGLITPAPEPAPGPTPEEEEVKPYLMIVDQDKDLDSPENAVYALFGSGAVRWIGVEEFRGLQALSVPARVSTDPGEIDRLRRAAELSHPSEPTAPAVG